MPRTVVWEIEDRDTDIAGLAPDAAHSATAIMTALFFSHRDESLGIPSRARRRIDSAASFGIVVTDSFGEEDLERCSTRKGVASRARLACGIPSQLVATASERHYRMGSVPDCGLAPRRARWSGRLAEQAECRER